MPDALQTTSYAPSPTDDVDESLVPSVPEKKPLLPSVYSRLVSALKTTSHAPLPTHDAKGLPSVPSKKTLLSSVFSWPVRLLRRFPLVSSFIASVILAGSVAGIVYRSYDWKRQDPFGGVKIDKIGVALSGSTHRLDLVSRTITIGWNIVECVDQGQGVSCGALTRAMDVYLNGPSKPTFSYDPAGFMFTPPKNTSFDSLSNFEANHSIGYLLHDSVPFDVLLFSASVVVMEKAGNTSVPIVGFAVSDLTDYFVISSSDWGSSKGNFTNDFPSGISGITTSISGIATSSSQVTKRTTVEVGYGWMWFEAKRSHFAYVFTLCLLLINWALAIGSIYITLLVIFGRQKMDVAVLLLPVTIVLIIPALRALYIGSPPLGGYIDTFGFFLQMMIVALCSMVLLYNVARQNRAPEQQDSADNESA